MHQPFSRRNFLKISGLAAAGAALAACKPSLTASPTASPGTRPASPSIISPTPNAPNPVTPLPTLVGTDLLTQALRRLTFGATPELVAQAQTLGLDAWLDEQLHPETIDDSQTELLLSRLSTLAMTPEARSQLDKRALPAQEIVLATLVHQRYSSRQVYELAVDFWSNHFNIYLGKNQCRFLKTDDDLQTIRPNALGKFADLLSASAHSPAMLVYLDNAESTRDIPNENYARELMELHTLSVNGGYSQFDVTALAQALTGWSVAGERDQRRSGTPLGTYLFRPAVHDATEKHILDLALPAGGGEQEGALALNYLAQHSHTARFISSKLARRFVADDPPVSLVDSLAAVFTSR